MTVDDEEMVSEDIHIYLGTNYNFIINKFEKTGNSGCNLEWHLLDENGDDATLNYPIVVENAGYGKARLKFNYAGVHTWRADYEQQV